MTEDEIIKTLTSENLIQKQRIAVLELANESLSNELCTFQEQYRDMRKQIDNMNFENEKLSKKLIGLRNQIARNESLASINHEVRQELLMLDHSMIDAVNAAHIVMRDLRKISGKYEMMAHLLQEIPEPPIPG